MPADGPPTPAAAAGRAVTSSADAPPATPLPAPPCRNRRPGGVAYTSSKQAIKGIVEAASMDYGPQGNRINAIAPGTTDTALVRPASLPDAIWTAFKRAWGPRNASGLHRMASPEEIARSVLPRATDEFSYMAGSTVLVGGAPFGGGPMNMPPGFPAG
ncbi:SDR family oxidoreductase [Nonomuraea sp. NPDC059007]|uniref:SDR family oxidoreductase n=1 Tax=Nonomuraea sp. NPDC059007 TaxID=3346692 RepID=UPI00367B8754